MNEKLLDLCELFVENKKILDECFQWDSVSMRINGAMILTNQGVLTTKSRISACKETLKKNASIFSNYRGHVRVPFISKMSLENDGQKYFDMVSSIYDKLQDNKVFKSEFAIISAMIIYDQIAEEELDHYITKTKLIFQQMKKDHSFLTNNDDIVFAAILAVSNIDIDNLLLEMDENYRILKNEYKSSNNQELSHILSIDMGAPGLKVEKLKRLYQRFKDEKLNFGKGYGSIALAVLSLIDIDEDEAFYQIKEVNDYLYTNKGFGWSMVRNERLSYAALLVTKAYKPDDKVIENVILYTSLRRAIDAQAAAAAAAAH